MSQNVSYFTAPVIGFANDEYDVYESSEMVSLIITKFGDIAESLTVFVITEDDSASEN